MTGGRIPVISVDKHLPDIIESIIVLTLAEGLIVAELSVSKQKFKFTIFLWPRNGDKK